MRENEKNPLPWQPAPKDSYNLALAFRPNLFITNFLFFLSLAHVLNELLVINGKCLLPWSMLFLPYSLKDSIHEVDTLNPSCDFLQLFCA